MTLKNTLLNTPNNIIKGHIQINAQTNKLYYKILWNIQNQNKEYLINFKNGDILSKSQKAILEKLDNLESLKCIISFDEIKSIIKRKNEQSEDEILKRFTLLQTSIFRFTTGESEDILTQAQLISEVNLNGGNYYISMSSKLYKYLFYHMGIGFSAFDLEALLNFKSQYSQMLYVSLRSWSGVKTEITYAVDELRNIFKVDNKYKAYKNLKQKAIMTAVNEINNSGAMEIIEIKENKKGTRSVQELTFVVKDLEPRMIMNEPKQTADVIWLGYIKVENEKLKERLELKYSDMDFNSPIVVDLFHRAYDKTLNRDNSFSMIQDKKGRTNLALFNYIVNGEILSNQLKLEEGFFENYID